MRQAKMEAIKGRKGSGVICRRKRRETTDFGKARFFLPRYESELTAESRVLTPPHIGLAARMALSTLSSYFVKFSRKPPAKSRATFSYEPPSAQVF